MTTTSLRASVRYRLNQTDNTNTQFDDDFIDELGNEGRRLFASILPEELLPNLRVYEHTEQTAISGYLAYRADFLRALKNKRVMIGSSSPNVIADKIESGQEWRLKFLESNDLTSSGSAKKYYRETGNGVEVYPTTDTKVYYPYLKVPGDLTAVEDSTFPDDVDDMVVDYAFEKCMGTKRGDMELAVLLAKNRGYRVRDISK